MASNIKQSTERFKKILEGRLRKDLKDFIKSDQIISRRGKNKVSIPLKYITLPRFKHGKNEEGSGTGQGDGEVGDPLAPGKDEGEGEGKQAGEGEGEHWLELDVSLEDLARILGEELQLPRIEPKGKKRVLSEFDHYSGERKVGPKALLRFKSTYKQALRRSISEGEYDLDEPFIEIRREDMRFRSWKTKFIPESDAVVFYLMDVSGSMGEEQKRMARKISFWTDLWLKTHYKGMESIYITHDYAAREVDEYTFYHTNESGGTMISSGYNLINTIIDKRYNPDKWNIYLFQYSDGDNWGGNDNDLCMKLLDEELLKKINLLAYAQTESQYGSGEFKQYLDKLVDSGAYGEKIVTHHLETEDDIMGTIKKFLGTGK